MANREDILNKVRALLSKTVENGCTEAEAMLALEMAGRMMDAHEITEDEIKAIEDEGAIIDAMFCERDPHAISWKLTYWIGKFTETYGYGSKYRIKFAGLRGDVDFAIWLTQYLTKFVQTELKAFMWKNGYQKLPAAPKRKVINGFVVGCCGRINTTLKQMIDKRTNVVNSTALVVAKNALIEAVTKDLDIKNADNRGRKTQMYHGAFQAGLKAGEKATFGRPIENNTGTLRLTNKSS